jgi:hypothetical protein
MPVPSLSEIKQKLMDAVDSHISGIYSKFTRFESEYRQREAAARAFKAGGYTGDAGEWVTSFGSNAGMTSTQATDAIIFQADKLHTALAQLGPQRMRKYSILSAANEAAARAAHADIIVQANLVAANL